MFTVSPNCTNKALLDYLKENPDAPNSEIRALLPSELQTLLPAGS